MKTLVQRGYDIVLETPTDCVAVDLANFQDEFRSQVMAPLEGHVDFEYAPRWGLRFLGQSEESEEDEASIPNIPNIPKEEAK